MKRNSRIIPRPALRAGVYQTLARLLALAAFSSLFAVSNPMSAQVWTQTGAPLADWLSVASSADGGELIASGDGTYVSTNSGSTWSLSLPGVGGTPYVTSSTNGTRLVVVSSIGIFASTNSGASWATNASLSGMAWQGVASSANGAKLVAVANQDSDGNPGPIYVSADSGNTWNPTTAPSNYWAAVASSADGTRLVAAANTDPDGNPGLIYLSSDSGNSWNPASAPGNLWVAVASSADGTRLVAAASSDGHGHPAPIYTSTDSGATWIPNPATTSMGAGYSWRSVASSADGMKLAAFGNLATPYSYPAAGVIVCSTNAGADWTATATLELNWACAASSADGSKVVVAVNGDGIFTDAATTSWGRCGAPRTNFWQSIATSADGIKLLASAGYNYITLENGPVYLSTDAGTNWAPVPALNTNGTLAVASSPDAARLVAAGQYVEISTNSGATWWPTGLPSGHWTSAAVSSNGSTLAVVSGGSLVAGQIRVSTNSGATWAAGGGAPTAGGWSSVACSWDGTKMVAAQYFSSFGTYGPIPGGIYTSTNSGSTWSPASAPSGQWVSVASSADGTHLVAASQPNVQYYTRGLVYFSTDSGVTWRSNNAVDGTWTSVASSADGTQFVAVNDGGGMLVSANSGTTWVTNPAPIVAWQPVAMSGDGSRIIAGALYGSIYISQSAQVAAPPRLSIDLSGSQILLTWPTNAAGYTLHQNTNLLTTDWPTVTNTPVTTNILYRVTLFHTNRQNFYRLQIP